MGIEHRANGMRSDQRAFLMERFDGLMQMHDADVGKIGRASADGVSYVRALHGVLDWLRGGSEPAPELLPFLELHLAETDVELNYDEVLKAVFEHDSLVAAITELQ
jgi:hypothetical protein